MIPEFQTKTHLNGFEGKYAIAQTVSKLIAAENNMVPVAPATVFTYMKHGLAAWLTNEAGDIGGFIKSMPWHPNLALVQGGLEEMETVALQNMDKGIMPTGIESGSLIVPPEYRGKKLGPHLKEFLATENSKKYPNVPIFSVVGVENANSIHLNEKMGWICLNPSQRNALMNVVGMDILQGWDAHIFLHPASLPIIQQ